MFGYSLQSGISSALGSCVGYVYMLLLMRSVDRVSPGDEVSMMEAEKVLTLSRPL